MDNYVLEKSLEDQDNTFNIQGSQLIYAPDMNNGGYQSGQIQFDLTTFSNGGRYLDFKNSFITIPLVMTLSGSFVQTKENAFAMSLKNGVHQLINGISIVLSNNEVVSNQPFTNLHVNYKILSSFSTTDVENWGPTLLFEKDTSQSQTWNAGVIGTSVGTNNGIGISNNIIYGNTGSNISVFNPANGDFIPENTGRAKRMLHTSWNYADNTMNAWSGWTPATQNPILPSAGNVATVAKNGVVTNNTTLIQYNILATIPLKFLHDFFDKCPLQKGGYFKLILNTNTPATSTITYNATPQVTNVVNITPYQQLPFQISPIAITASSNTGLVVATASTSMVANLSIVKNSNGLGTSHPFSTCRFYGRCLDLAPSFESHYLSNPIKTVRYNDMISYYTSATSNISSGNQCQTTLTQSLARLRKLYIFPFFNSSSNGGISPLQSPFASEPATCSPYAWVSQLQVFLSQVPIYPEPKTYRFLNFLEESHGGNSIDGSLVNSLSGGLLNQHDYDTTYGVVVIDLSRHDVSQDDIAKSVGIQFTNLSPVAMDYICLIEFQREININCESGSLVL